MIKDIAQEKGIEKINSNVAINAGAGTGKTRILVERFMNILENGELVSGHEVQSIVAITFTKKAAEEMITRVRERLGEKLGENPKWDRYYRDLERANISTIHSFCASILRENPIESNIDPMFKILESRNSEAYLEEAILKVINEIIYSEEGYNFFKELELDYVLELVSDLKRIYLDIRTYGDNYQNFKSQLKSQFENMEIKKETIDKLKELIKSTFEDENLSKNSNFYKMKKSEEWLDFKTGNYNDEKLEKILLYIYSQIGTSSKDSIKEKYNIIKRLIDENLITFEKSTKDRYEYLLEIIFKIDKKYSKIKEREGFLDYDDLQIKVNKLLENPKIRDEYQHRYRYIMVDECQDTNELQKEIFYKLSTKEKLLDRNNLFIVGDPKQSIYRFRGADLDVFYEMVEDIKSIDRDNEIVLRNNYRTTLKLMNQINDIFSKLMGDSYNALNPIQVSKRLEGIEVINEPKDIESPREYEAKLIAQRIKNLVDDEGYDYSDIGILLKATTDVELYEDSLLEYSIPYYNNSGRGFFQTQEVVDLTNALKSIFNSFDLISNIGFLRSPMIGLSDDIIFKLMQKPGNILEKVNERLNDKDISFFEKEKLEEINKIYQDLFKFRNKNGFQELTNKIIDITYYKEISILREGNKQILGNIKKFEKLMRNYDDLYMEEGTDFLEYLDFIYSEDEEQFNIGSEESNVVNILTIHKSKGLEFPVVFIPDLSRGSRRDYSKFKYHRELGFGVKTLNYNKVYDLIKDKLFEKDDEEEIRLLYVAMTRAEELLILGGQNSRNAGFMKILSDKISKYPTTNIKEIEKSKKYKFKSIKELCEVENRGNKKPLNVFDLDTSKLDRTDRISFSRYNEFANCRRRYYYRYVNNIEQKHLDFIIKLDSINEDKKELTITLDPRTRGDIIHNFCYEYRKSIDKNELLRNIVEREGYKLEEIQQEINPYIENFIYDYNNKTQSVDKIYREKEFFYKKDKWSFTGSIDRIDVMDDGFKIVDYKTGYPNKEYLKDYIFQVQFYGYIVSKILNKKAKLGEILFLSINKVIEVDMSQEILKERFNEIYEFAKWTSENKEEDKYEKSTDCTNCQYEIFCRKG